MNAKSKARKASIDHDIIIMIIVQKTVEIHLKRPSLDLLTGWWGDMQRHYAAYCNGGVIIIRAERMNNSICLSKLEGLLRAELWCF